MRKILFTLSFVFSAFIGAISQSEDTVLVAENTPFLKDLLSNTYTPPPILGKPQTILKTTYPYSLGRGQYVMVKQGAIYVFLEGTGKVYKSLNISDSLISFRRIDKTVNMNYNGGGLTYLYNGNIHVYGGYGFWKTNGTDKMFSEKDGEWDVVPHSEEIIASYSPLTMAWHNRMNEKLIVPYQQIYNSGIADPIYQSGKVFPISYELDLKTKKWIALGETDPKSLAIMRKAILRLTGDKGLYLHSEGNLYEIDLVNNRVSRMTDQSITQSFARVAELSLLYERNHMLYYYNPATKNKDSLLLDPAKFQEMPFPVYAKQNNNLTVTAAGGGFILMLLGFLYWKKRKGTRPAETTDQSFAPPKNEEKITFTDTEWGLIKLLQDKMKEQETANLSEINYVLGVKDKNIGLQKKVRSDVIKSINQKYRQISGKEGLLIQSIRSTTDKRFFEYYLTDPEFVPIGE